MTATIDALKRSMPTRLRLVSMPNGDTGHVCMGVAKQRLQLSGESWRSERVVPLAMNPDLPDHCAANPAAFGDIVGRMFAAALATLMEMEPGADEVMP